MATEHRPHALAVRRVQVAPAIECDACAQPVTELLTFDFEGKKVMVCEPCMKQVALQMPTPEGKA